MNEFVSTLASKAGIDPGNVQSGMGAVLSTLQKFVPTETFSRFASAIPDSGSMLREFQATATTTISGTASAITGLASALLGGSSEVVSTLMTRLSQAGLSMEMIKRFLPAAAAVLRDRIPADVLRQVDQSIPGFTSALSTAGNGGMAGKLGGLF
jgi:hypothetical protein